jgi:tetratricopeptide (TPR) repeat protein
MSLLEEPGDLAVAPLAAILIEALNVRASGVLEVGHAGGTSRLWFSDGRPVGAQVFAGFKPLGMLLLQEGLIDIDALSASLARMAEARRPQGEILIEMGAVSADDVGRVLEQQQAGYFALIASLRQGPFVFDASTPVPAWTRGSRLSPVRTIVDALEQPQASALVASALQPVAASGVRLSAAYPDVAGAFRWSDAERRLVARLERDLSLEAFFSPSDVAPERAPAILAGLLLLGLARPGLDGPATVETAGDEGTAGIAIGPEEASPPQAGGAPADARRSDPGEARARRQRLLQHAMRNMGIGPFAGRDGPGTGEPSGLADTPAPAPPPSAAPPPGATQAEAALREALLALLPRGGEQDLFARLALPDTAGKDDARRAFLALARMFHPDRFSSPALADLQPAVKDFFASMNEAHEVLCDDRKRAEYLDRSKGTGAARWDAGRAEAEKGEACLRTRDFQRARGFLEAAVRAEPRPEYQAALAWAYVADPSCRDRERARALVASAMRDRSCDRAFFVAGVIARDEGDTPRAERHFRAATQANPRNADAARELRLLEARRSERPR